MATNSGRPASGSKARPYVPPVRQNTRLIGAHFPPDIVKEFKFMVVELESTGQALVIEGALKRDAHSPFAESDGLWKCQAATLKRLVQLNGGIQPLLLSIFNVGLVDPELRRIQHQSRRRLSNRDRNGLLTVKERLVEIRFQPQLVSSWNDMPWKPVRIAAESLFKVHLFTFRSNRGGYNITRLLNNARS